MNARSLVRVQCARCNVDFGICEATESTLRKSGAGFCCPFGHSLSFPLGPSVEDQLRRERDRLKQENARLEEYRLASERAEQVALEHARHQKQRAAAARGQVTKLKKRAAAGVCPCCNRQFVNLMRHMATKHSGFGADEAPH